MRKLLVWVGGVLSLLLLLLLGALAYASHQLSRRYVAPAVGLPQISAERLAHGERLFRAVCADCHSPAGETGPTGRWIADVPGFLGKFYSRNLTSDPTAGIGAVSDQDLARAIRYGVSSDGRLMVVMPHFGQMGDEDLAAIIAFLRSGHRDLLPHPVAQPSNQPSWIGKLIMVFVVGVGVEPSGSVATPAAGPTVEYGRYVADALYQCGYCHTPGFDGKKGQKPGIYGGGFALADPQGREVLTANLTPHETGIKSWSLPEFTRAVRDGIRPDGSIVRPPMPRMRLLDDVEMAALFAYLRSLPPIDHAIARPAAAASADPAQLFASLGCATCHAQGAPFHEQLRHAIDRPVAEIAAWIRNPEASRPNTQMPTYAAILDEPKATLLAQWLQHEVREGR
jgi:mono/diheme cytochrome c family protein